MAHTPSDSGARRARALRESPRRAEWERIRAGGLRRYVLVRGILVRGVPMAIAVMLLLVGLSGQPVSTETFASLDFLWRLALAVVLFSLGGMLSAYARWRALDLRFGADAGDEGEGR